MNNSKNGSLIVAGLHIGNIKDIPTRTIEALKECDLIVSEHAEMMEKYFTHIGIEYNGSLYNYLPELEDRDKRIQFICSEINNGKKVLLICSEGMPLIHDPGYEIVRDATSAGLQVTVIPGPSAPIAALSVSGLDSWRFSFESDIETDKDKRKEQFQKVKNYDKTLIYFDKDWQLLNSLEDIADIFGKYRQICICINLTLPDEFIFRGLCYEALDFFQKNPIKIKENEKNKIVVLISQG